MRLAPFSGVTGDFDEMVTRLFADSPARSWSTQSYAVPMDVFHVDGSLVIRMDLPDVDPDAVEVTVQENTLLVNGTRRFPYDAESVRFVRRGTFYGDFTQRVALGKGLDVEQVAAHYENGVLELRIPYAEEIKPKRIAIEKGTKALSE